MYRTSVCLVRGGGFLSRVLGNGKAKQEYIKLTTEQQEKLRKLAPSLRIDQEVFTKKIRIWEVSDELVDSRVDIDSIRARGFLKYCHNYVPSVSVRDDVIGCVSKVSGHYEGTYELKDNQEKARIIVEIAKRIGHMPTNSRLMHLKTVDDLVAFYSEPIKNITTYSQLARSKKKPKNVSIVEHPVRFHPEDTHAWHGGVTAFPGQGGQILGLRNKRLLRQFKPKSDWYDYEEQAFDYSRPDEGMPWDPEIAKQMDRYPDRKLNFKTKTFAKSG